MHLGIAPPVAILSRGRGADDGYLCVQVRLVNQSSLCAVQNAVISESGGKGSYASPDRAKRWLRDLWRLPRRSTLSRGRNRKSLSTIAESFSQRRRLSNGPSSANINSFQDTGSISLRG